MTFLDPHTLFQQLADDVPPPLHAHLLITGSLAAAYHYRAQLDRYGVNTKDADVVVHPAGDVHSTRDLAHRLRELGWWADTAVCFPRPTPDPPLRAIRLHPPGRNDYFVEFLNVPDGDQEEFVHWGHVHLSDGFYGLPTFRFLGLTTVAPLASHTGIRYAAPSMMALSNLLAHPHLGDRRIESGFFERTLRSAKDLGRVLALAYLAGRDETERWLSEWVRGVRTRFPDRAADLAANAGSGLRELLDDSDALEEARRTTDHGLLSGRGVTLEQLQSVGERLFLDLIDPFSMAVNDTAPKPPPHD